MPYDPFGDSGAEEPGKKRSRVEPGKSDNSATAGPGDAPPETPREPLPSPALSIFWKPPPLDDRARALVFMLLQTITSHNIEVEVKLGTVNDRGVRVEMPNVTSEVVLFSEEGRRCPWSFQSAIGKQAYSALNSALNFKVHESRAKATAGETVPVTYKRTTESNIFFDSPSRYRLIRDWHLQSDHYSKIEDSSLQRKSRLKDLDFLSPARLPLDFRCSASKEIASPISDIKGLKATHERLKNRLSYTYGPFRVELTTVQSFNKIHPSTFERQSDAETTYEVEIEVRTEADLPELCRRYRQHDRTGLERLAVGLLANVRALIAEVDPNSR